MAKTAVKGHMKPKGPKYKVINGKEVRPCLYVGTFVGHGKYMAATYIDESFVLDKDNKPIPYSQIIPD